MGNKKDDRQDLTNRIKTGLLVSFIIYLLLSVLIILFTVPLLKLMAADSSIIEASATYIRIESIANIFAILYQFVLVVLVTLDKSKYIYSITFSKLLISILLDTFLVSSLPFSLNLGVNGIGISNIISNTLLFVITIILLHRENILVFSKEKLSFKWISKFTKVGAVSGAESFVRNLAYMLMISRMVNVVNEQGTYWVANSFIWSWLLLPVSQLAELIKQEVSTNKKAVKENTAGYFGITTIICSVWFITMPLWKMFMKNVLQYDDVDKLFSLVILLVGFYVLYAYQNIFDATFYGLGKTNYMLFESIVTNSIYYGTAFILYLKGIWTPTLNSIALLFGVGMAFDSIVSFGAYMYLLKKQYNK